jgi:hypothetical protein
MARCAKGAPREKLAKAAGYRSDAEIAAQFPLKRQKQLRQLQQSLADLASGLSLDHSSFSAVARQYDLLIRSLLGQSGTNQPSKQSPRPRGWCNSLGTSTPATPGLSAQLRHPAQ